MRTTIGGKRRKGPDSNGDPGEGRVAKRRRATRARLLEAAYQVIAEAGVADAKIKDITDRADVGFGTFYNYFSDKDAIASQVLDCVINDYGRRNVVATRSLRKDDPALVIPVSMRLVLREVARTPMWQWWALRPDLLADRMRDGFGPFGKHDIREGIALGVIPMAPDEVDRIWALMIWVMVGGVHDVVVGDQPLDSDMFVAEAVMRMLGVAPAIAREICSSPLPQYAAPDVDWSFELADPTIESL